MARRKTRRAKHARLIVGEGTAEQRFLHHLKSLFLTRAAGLNVKIRLGRGGSPDHLVDYTIRQTKHAAYDSLVVWMDTDFPWSAQLQSRASGNNPPIALVGSEPCVDGLLLRILGEPVDPRTQRNKTRLNRLTKVSCPSRINFEKVFPKTMLQDAAGQIEVLAQLINYVSRP